jgi:legumain
MKYAVIFVLFAVAAVSCNPPKPGGVNWAVLVAGSNSYYNYRHQSDICHAFQTLIRNGFPAEKIIVFMYDDIANNPQNPHKGEVINHVGGANVYPGVTKDYVGASTTASNFLAVLSGQKSKVVGGSGRVVESGPNDNIFVFYSDHGAVGLVAMPVGPYLYATDLIATLKYMSANKRFNQLVFYLEACESGSMFEDILPANIQIYTTTASNAHESSYACYWDAERAAYLGDLYSVNWMEDTDASDPRSENFLTQFQNVKVRTDLSHVMQYGDLSFNSFKLFDFLGYNKAEFVPRMAYPVFGNASADAVDSRDVVLETLKRREESATGKEKTALRQQIHEETARRFKADRIFRAFDTFARSVNNGQPLSTELKMNDQFNWDCYKQAVENYESECGKFNDYSMKYTRNLAVMCANNISADDIAHVTTKICKIH